MLVQLEPVRQRAEYEEEHGESKEKHAGEDAARVPDLAGEWRHEVSCFEASVK